MRLANVYLEYAPGARFDADGKALLDARLNELVAEARAAWPKLAVPLEAFVQHLAERAPEAAGPELASLHATDLYLACACARGDKAALSAFEEQHMSRIARYLRSADALSAFTDEVKQVLRERLLVAGGGLVPRIASYNGRGPLAGWVRMAAARVAVDLRRAQHSERPLSEAAPVARLDPELSYLKARYRQEFETAIEQTIKALPARELAVLRLVVLDGLSSSAVAGMYQVSSRTVQRWVVDIRESVVQNVRAALADRLQLSTAAFDSLMGLVQSDLELSVQRIFDQSKKSGP